MLTFAFSPFIRLAANSRSASILAMTTPGSAGGMETGGDEGAGLNLRGCRNEAARPPKGLSMFLRPSATAFAASRSPMVFHRRATANFARGVADFSSAVKLAARIGGASVEKFIKLTCGVYPEASACDTAAQIAR